MITGAKLTLKKLLYDDSGVAMAYTVLVSLFIFMLCVSTFAMTENIRKKIELQNACDAAAYSGAVVQADMLSRIAVLNRALSWTYFQTSKRNMDYIISDWIANIDEEYSSYMNGRAQSISGINTSQYYDCPDCTNGISGYETQTDADGNEISVAITCTTCSGSGGQTVTYTKDAFTASGVRDCHFCLGCGGTHGQAKKHSDKGSDTPPAGWFMGWSNIDHVQINNHREVELWEADSDSDTVSLTAARSAVIAAPFKTDLDNGRANLTTISNAIDHLKSNINVFVKAAIIQSMTQNAPVDNISYIWTAGCGWGKDSAPDYFALLTSETDFLHYIRERASNFSTGYNKWWSLSTDPDSGIRRVYTGGQDGGVENITLTASFRYWATVWGRNPYTQICHYLLTSLPSTTVSNINPTDTAYFEMPYSRPVQLKNNFFGPDGTIVVAAKRALTNPFAAFLGGDASSALYGAFSGTGNDMWALSAARAGLRFNNQSAGQYSVFRQKETDTRSQYNAAGVWNLCEEDWDAVMLPVSRAWNTTQISGWGTGQNNGIDETTNSLLKSARTTLGVQTSYVNPTAKYNPFNPTAEKR